MAAPKYLIILAGPTAVGKTALSIELAKVYQSSIISSDSRQYYREMSIGTAKPSKKEQHGVIHHFIDSLSIHDQYSIGQFERDVLSLLEEQYSNSDIMLMTGGSGMHIRAITHGLDDFPDVPLAIRDKWEETLKQSGIEALKAALKDQDPKYAAMVDMDNSRRLVRALSVMEVGNQTFSSYLNQPAKQRSFTPIYILLQRERKALYKRINERVDHMIENGLIDEAKQLRTHAGVQALNTIGYKELFAYFDGQVDLETAISLIKRNSRRYAKRQMTWFRKETQWNIFDPGDMEGIRQLIASKVKKG